MTVKHAMYHKTILPRSLKKAYLLLVIGPNCNKCVWAEESWETSAQELKDAGIGIGTVHASFSNLSLELGINKWPYIVGVLEERIHYFGSQIVNTANLKALAMQMFPTTLIDKVDDENFQSFLAGHSDNCPRTLLFSRRSVPSLLYLSTAYKFRDKMAFGFASFKSRVHNMRRQYGVDSTCLLVFKEDADNYVASLEASMLKRESIRNLIMDNQYLYAPRLSSQSVFDDLCPVSQSKKNRTVCVILFTKRGKNHNEFRRTFSQVAANKSFYPEGSRFMYVYEETQRNFTGIMGVEFTNDSTLPVAVGWRKNIKKFKFDWLPGGWKENDKDGNQRRLRDCLVELSNYNFTLKLTRKIETMKDENEQHWLTLWIRSMWSTCKASMQYIYNDEEIRIKVPLYIIIFVVYLVFEYIKPRLYKWIRRQRLRMRLRLSSTAFAPKNRPSRWEYIMEPLLFIVFVGLLVNDYIRSRLYNWKRRQRKPHIMSYSLDPVSNATLVQRAPPGQMTLLILVDQASINKLFVEAQKAIKYQMLRTEVWQFAYLRVDKYSSWYEKLTNRALGTLDINKVIGDILAINGGKKYYCLYSARTQIAAYRATHTNDENLLHIDNFYAPLPMWIDRLYDGSAPKKKVTVWPTFEPRRQHIIVYSPLDPVRIETLILRAPPSKMTLLILVDQANMKELFVKVQKTIKYQIQSIEGWQFSYLRVDEHSSWYEKLTNQALGTLDINKVIGDILAINGHNKYYHLYNARTQIADYRASHQNLQVNPESCGDDGNDFYAPLPMWINGLFDGSLPTIRVTKWPKFDHMI